MSEGREALLSIAEAALAAADPAPLVRRVTRRLGVRRAHCLAVGKAAARMIEPCLGFGEALAVVPEGYPLPDCPVVVSDHPLPGERSETAARRALSFARAATDTLLLLVSGGASSALFLPVPGVRSADLRRALGALLSSGLPIAEANALRSRLCALKGGGLAASARGEVVCLLLSDVEGDDPRVIGGGLAAPFPPMPVGPERYLGALARRLRTDEGTGDARNVVVGNILLAVRGAAARARALGFSVRLRGGYLRGEARDVGRAMACELRAAPRGACLVAGGETTVTVRGEGRGGRNTELALAAALVGFGSGSLLALATDGVDGSSGAAGAVVDAGTVERARARGVDAREALRTNDARSALLDDLLVTGPTGTNVGDVVVALKP